MRRAYDDQRIAHAIGLLFTRYGTLNGHRMENKHERGSVRHDKDSRERARGRK